jgi:hypothetical protein
MPDTWGKTWWRNIYACGCMIQLIEDVIEPRLGRTVNVFQGAYNTSVGASAGTHSGGGALDHLKGNDAETIIWRESGVADWQRGTPEDNYFDDHNHGIWQGCPHLSGDASGQVDQYEVGCDGLSGWGPDQSPSVKPISWQDAYDKYADTEPPAPEGLFEMTKSVYQRRDKDSKVSATDWDDLKINDDDGYSVVSGVTKQITVSANLQISGMKAGENFDLCWRIAKYKEGKETTYPYVRNTHRVWGSGKATDTVDAVFNGGLPDLGDGYSPRLRLSYKTTSKTATITSIICEGWES